MPEAIQFERPKAPNMLQLLRQGQGQDMPVPYPEVATSAPASTPAPVGPVQPSESAVLSSQLSKLTAPPSTKESLVRAALAFAPAAVAGLAGGLPAAAGAAQGTNAAFTAEAAQKERERQSLIDQVQAARTREMQEGQFSSKLAQDQAEMNAANARNAATVAGENTRAANTLAETVRYHNEELRKPIPVPERGLIRPGENEPFYIPPMKPENLTGDEQDYADYIKDPAKTQKYGADRLGFLKWKNDETGPLYPVFRGTGVTHEPRSVASHQPAPRTLYDVQGQPTTGGVPGVSMQPPPVVPDITQTALAGLKTSIDLLDKEIIPQLKNVPTEGPIWGRLKRVAIKDLGGWGTTPEEKTLAITLQRSLSSQAFSEGGKQLTPTELEQFTLVQPRFNDTVEQAIIKADLATAFLKSKYQNRLAMMPIRERLQLPGLETVAPVTSQPAAAPAEEWIRDPVTKQLRKKTPQDK